MQSRAGVAKRHGLAPGLGSHGDTVAHRRGTELFQWRIELQVEVRVFRLLDQYPATHQGASDARNQGVEQLAQLVGRRRRCAVEVGFVVLEGIGAIGHEVVAVYVQIERRAEALARIVPTILLHSRHPWRSNEGDDARLGALARTQARSSYDGAGQGPGHNPQDAGQPLGPHGEQVFEAGDAWVQPPEIEHALVGFSEDFEVLEIVMPANFDTVDL